MGVAMQRVLILAALLAAFIATSLAAPVADPTQPHLAQAWQAQSSGDGEKGQTGLESYIYEDCPKGKTSETCLHGHVFNYGANNCIKIEVDGGFKYPYGKHGSETYYVKCDAVDCCYSGKGRPDVKKWDINTPNLVRKVTYEGVHDTTELNNNPVKSAEVWNEVDKLPFTKAVVNYTYFVTRNNTDVITHRINYAVPGTKVQGGSILFGDFKVQHNVTAFRDVFKPPAACNPKHVLLRCPPSKMKEWDQKYFMHGAAMKGN